MLTVELNGAPIDPAPSDWLVIGGDVGLTRRVTVRALRGYWRKYMVADALERVEQHGGIEPGEYALVTMMGWPALVIRTA